MPDRKETPECRDARTYHPPRDLPASHHTGFRRGLLPREKTLGCFRRVVRSRALEIRASRLAKLSARSGSSSVKGSPVIMAWSGNACASRQSREGAYLGLRDATITLRYGPPRCVFSPRRAPGAGAGRSE